MPNVDLPLGLETTLLELAKLAIGHRRFEAVVPFTHSVEGVPFAQGFVIVNIRIEKHDPTAGNDATLKAAS